MSEQITIKQHFAPRFYFKRFAHENSLQTLNLKRGQIIKPQPYAGVCYAPFYYAVETGEEDEISQEFEAFFKSIEDQFALRYDGIIDSIINNKQLTFDQLDSLSWFIACLWLRSPIMRQQLNTLGEQMTRQMIAAKVTHPDFAKSAIAELAKENITITEEQANKVGAGLMNGDIKVELTNGLHLIMIAKCEQYRKWFLAKNWRFYIAKSSKQFITSDTPVVEIYDKDNRLFGNHIMQRQHFFALTPNILIELTNPLTTGKRVKHSTVNNAQVEQYNLLRAQHSKDFCYSHNRSDIEDLLPYYEGRLTLQQAVRDYLDEQAKLTQ